MDGNQIYHARIQPDINKFIRTDALFDGFIKKEKA